MLCSYVIKGVQNLWLGSEANKGPGEFKRAVLEPICFTLDTGMSLPLGKRASEGVKRAWAKGAKGKGRFRRPDVKTWVDRFDSGLGEGIPMPCHPNPIQARLSFDLYAFLNLLT